jgi:hypothetical protein
MIYADMIILYITSSVWIVNRTRCAESVAPSAGISNAHRAMPTKCARSALRFVQPNQHRPYRQPIQTPAQTPAQTPVQTPIQTPAGRLYLFAPHYAKSPAFAGLFSLFTGGGSEVVEVEIFGFDFQAFGCGGVHQAVGGEIGVHDFLVL